MANWNNIGVAEDADVHRGISGMGVPLRMPLFRRIWVASLLSNFGLMIQGVGAAWAMTQLTPAADMVALVQTALMLPMMLVSLPAGAIADMYDRRKVALAALLIALAGAGGLALVTLAGWLTPWLLLGFCFLIGAGQALFSPAWQASVSEQVPASALPQAVALNSISFNIARSFGPAIGGLIVAAAGAMAAFAANALCYVPLFIVLLLWRRVAEPSRLPPERLNRAVTSGVRYVVHSPAIRVVLWRTVVTATAAGSISALMPIVARDLLGGGAFVYGLILGAFGMGAVAGALNIAAIRQRFDGERAVILCSLIMALGAATVALSGWIWLTMVALFLAGIGWMVSLTLYNIGVQLVAPRWVSGRTLAAFQTAAAGGLAIGSWFWGNVAESHGVTIALLGSAAMMAASAVLGRWLRMPPVNEIEGDTVELRTPDVALALTARSGPIVIEVEYRIDPARARSFYEAMQQVQLTRHRNGAYDWSISRDITDPELWTERFHCPTWLDYQRMLGRFTPAEIDLQKQAREFHLGAEPVRVRRMLERPFGSVRWKEDAPDRNTGEVMPVTNA